MRHGQASFGAPVYDQLSELGERQAHATGAHLRRLGRRFDMILSGPLARQKDTARAVMSGLPTEQLPIDEPALAEFAPADLILGSAGRHFDLRPQGQEALSRTEVLRHYDAQIRDWAAGRVSIDGAPSMATFRAQVRQWLRSITRAPQNGQMVLAVTSAGVIGTILCEVLGLADARMSELTRVISNASLTELAYSKGRRSLHCFNSDSHLAPDLRSGM